MFSAAGKRAAAPSGPSTYVEDVFSAFQWGGTYGTLGINNGIDLSTYGGMVIAKNRTFTYSLYLGDTSTGANYYYETASTAGKVSDSSSFQSFNSNGFTIGGNVKWNYVTPSMSWTFRKADKFFDVVTYTGNGTARTIAHNLKSVPGCIIVKRTDTTGDWVVYHRSLTSASYHVKFNTNADQVSDNTIWNGTDPTSSEFSVGTSTQTNANGGTYVAYIFGHDTSKYGLIQCGSYTGNGDAAGQNINLGWESQFLIQKCINREGTDPANWFMLDTCRGMSWVSSNRLSPNAPAAETVDTANFFAATNTGFKVVGNGNWENASGKICIYIAIRRGPMKPPTSANQVFALESRGGSGANTYIVGLNQPDLALVKVQNGFLGPAAWCPRLTNHYYMTTNGTVQGKQAYGVVTQNFQQAMWSGSQYGFGVGNGQGTTGVAVTNSPDGSYINFAFKRAPGFFDVVPFVGTGTSGLTVNHNLGVAPELIITKKMTATSTNGWVVGGPIMDEYIAYMNLDSARSSSSVYSSISSTSYTLNNDGDVNASGQSHISYLFASSKGISKIGTFVGNGSTQSIDCGFAATARFIMIKCLTSTGWWWFFDSARGINSSNSPFMGLNQGLTNDYYGANNSVSPYAPGFSVINNDTTMVNSNGQTYLYIAIA